MDSKDCSDDPLFVVLVELLHNLNPSANSAYYLGLLNDKKNDSKLEIEYYNESIDLETDNLKKAKILYKIALKFKKLNNFLNQEIMQDKALEYQPSMGKAYLLIGNLYASSANNCGTSQFEKRSIYWLALEEAKKAASVDATVRKLALKLLKVMKVELLQKQIFLVKQCEVKKYLLTVGLVYLLLFLL